MVSQKPHQQLQIIEQKARNWLMPLVGNITIFVLKQNLIVHIHFRDWLKQATPG